MQVYESLRQSPMFKVVVPFRWDGDGPFLTAARNSKNFGGVNVYQGLIGSRLTQKIIAPPLISDSNLINRMKSNNFTSNLRGLGFAKRNLQSS